MASAYAREGRATDAAVALLEADVYATFVQDAELTAEVLYCKAGAAYIARQYDLACEIATSAVDDAAPLASAKLLSLLAVVRGLRGNPAEQIETLLTALSYLDRSPTRDTFLEASILNNIAIPAAELNPPGLRALLAERYERIIWTSENAKWQFFILHHLAWLDALHGDHLSAFGRFRLASRVAPTNAWRAHALAGRAYLAIEMDEKLTAAECFNDALSTLSAVDWSASVAGESTVLLKLASIAARTDVAQAKAMLLRYDLATRRVDPTYTAAHGDPDSQAHKAHAQGLVACGEGRVDDGVASLREAHGLFSSAGSTWRAAVVALDLYDVTHEEDMFVFAREQAARVPHSWLARRLIQTSPLPEYHKDEIA